MSDGGSPDENVESSRPRRRGSILKQNLDVVHVPSVSSLSHKARRRSIQESDRRIDSAPVVFDDVFENVQVDECEAGMMRRSSRKELGVTGATNLDNLCKEDVNFYRPRRESLLLRNDTDINQQRGVNNPSSAEYQTTSSMAATIGEDSTDSLSDDDQNRIRQFLSNFVGGSHSSHSSHHEKNKRVSFATVQINEHPCIVGDNPSVSSGVPLAIDWRSSHSESILLDKYEELRQNDRRFLHELKVPSDVRWERLKNSGVSSEDIVVSSKCLSGASFVSIAVYYTFDSRSRSPLSRCHFIVAFPNLIDWNSCYG